MKIRADLNYQLEKAIFDFNKTEDKHTFFNTLDVIASQGENLMVRLSDDSTILYNITQIKLDLSLPTTHSNYKLIREMLQNVTNTSEHTFITIYE